MIYHSYDMVRKGTRPAVSLLDASHKLLRHESNPWRDTLPARFWATALELPLRGLKDYVKQPYRVRGRDGEGEIVLAPRVVESLPFADLLGFPGAHAEQKPKVLVAAALSGHHATLLEDTVRGFARDFDPYITDWRSAREVPAEAGKFGFDEYVEHLIHFIETLGPGTHLVATCQAAPPALVAAAVLAERNPAMVPASLTLMAGPIDTRVNAGMLNKIASKLPLWLFKEANIKSVPGWHAGAGRRVYPGFYQLTAFILLNPGPHFKSYWRFIKNSLGGNDEAVETFRKFYDEYFSVLDMTEDFYMETLERVFFQHHIPNGQMTYQGQPVDFTALRDMALLTVEGEKDDFCPVGQTEAAHAVCPNIPAEKRGRHVAPGVGHYGIFSGSKFQDRIYPVIRDFVKAA